MKKFVKLFFAIALLSLLIIPFYSCEDDDESYDGVWQFSKMVEDGETTEFPMTSSGYTINMYFEISGSDLQGYATQSNGTVTQSAKCTDAIGDIDGNTVLFGDDTGTLSKSGDTLTISFGTDSLTLTKSSFDVSSITNEMACWD